MTATLALPAAVRGRSAALPAAALDALAAATFLRCSVLLAVVRFLAAAGARVGASSVSRVDLGHQPALAARGVVRMDDALLGGLVERADRGGDRRRPVARRRGRVAMLAACRTSVLASLRVRRLTARRRSDWRTRLSADGVRAPFQVRAVLATWNPQLESCCTPTHARGARAEAEYSIGRVAGQRGTRQSEAQPATIRATNADCPPVLSSLDTEEKPKRRRPARQPDAAADRDNDRTLIGRLRTTPMTTITLPDRLMRPVATPPARRATLIGFGATLLAGS